VPAPTGLSQVALPLALQPESASLLNVILDIPSGSGFPSHTHGGPLVVTVLEGEITLTEGGTSKTFRAGESWTEMPGDVHSAVNTTPSTTRVALAALLPDGAELTTFTAAANASAPAGMPRTGSGSTPDVAAAALSAFLVLVSGLALLLYARRRERAQDGRGRL
jgi:quercetin dioxygenase-like cupin family protein